MLEDAINKLPNTAPSTRYQGSKRKILPWLYDNIQNLKFKTVLDGFGGTASVSYLFKLMKKQVTFNDVLLSNFQTGIAVIENSSVLLNKSDLNFLFHENGFDYPTLIQDTFKDIYYLDTENKWLDTVTFNIHQLSEIYTGNQLRKKKALAFHLLFQACLTKRPFNLFHRKNLYLRLANVERSFGNRTTWNIDFDTLFLRYHNEILQKIFSNGLKNKAICKDVLDIKNNFDLVYLDPPYARLGTSVPKDYHKLYHFLEGLVDYDNWEENINWSLKNKRLKKKEIEWDKHPLEKKFDLLFKKFQDSIIIISYGEPGNPPILKIQELLLQYKSEVTINKTEYIYKLNRKNGKEMCEVLIMGK